MQNQIKHNHLLFILALALLPCVNNAQNNTEYDSLLNVYQTHPDDLDKIDLLDQLHDLTLYQDIDLAKKYADEQLTLAKKLNDPKSIGFAYGNQGGYYKNLGLKDSAKYYFIQSKQLFKSADYLKGEIAANKSIAIIELATGNADRALAIIDSNIMTRITLNDSTGLASDYNFKGGIYEHKGNQKLALENVLKAVKIYELQGNQIGKADAYLVLSALENANDNLQLSLNYELEALKIYEENNDKLYTALTYSSIGGGYNNLKDYEKAKHYLELAIQKAKELKSLDIEGDAKTKLGVTMIRLKNYEAGINILNEALTINKENDRTLNQIRNLNAISNAYNKMEQPNYALPYATEAIKLAESIGAPETLFQAYFSRSESYEKQHNYKSAFQDHQQYKIYHDSVFKIEKSKQIERLRAEFDTERKEKELIIEKDKVEILEKEAALNRLQKTLLGLGLGFVLMVGGLGYYGFRQTIKRNQLEKEKLDAELAFKKKELTTHALHLAKKNELLESLKKKATELKTADEPKQGYQKLINSINFDLQDDNNWANFSKYFEEVHTGFNVTAIKKYPAITPNDLRLMALLKMNLSSKEIANILNISIPGIKKARQRLRKKMNLKTSDSLETAVLRI